MDILTQGLLGASLAQSAAPREQSRGAAVVGFVNGLLADADILIQSANDPLLNLDYHRHFTHSLSFIPVGALIGATLLRPFFRARMSFPRLYGYSLLGYLLSGILDACTSYGTHLLWPFSDTRSAWSLVSVIDPLFTAFLLSGVAIAVYTRRSGFAKIGLLFCAFYLAFAFWQQQRAVEEVSVLAQERGHTLKSDQVITKPSFANVILWRTIYISEGRIYVDAIRPGLFGETRVYQGESVPLFGAETDYLAILDATEGEEPATDELHNQAAAIPSNSILARDIQRFRRFSDGYVAVHPERPGTLGDIRFSMMPDSALPMWGIALDLERPDQHAEFRTFREMGPADRERFVQMLMGR